MINKLLPQLLLLAAAVCQLNADDAGKNLEPAITPRVEIFAEFMANSKCPVYEKNDAVRLWIKIEGDTTLEDSLAWGVSDWQGRLLDNGAIPVPKIRKSWTQTLDLKNFGSGYFEVHLKLDKCNISLPAAGSRPAGMVAYAVLPDIKRLNLDFADQSRFGAMGDCFIKNAWNKVDPVYGLMGAKWKYLSRWPFALAKSEAGPDSYAPCLDQEKAKALKSCEADAGLCVFVDAQGLPAWLTKFPDSVKPEDIAKFSRANRQSYPPNDYGKYADIIGKIAAEQYVFKKARLPHQRKNYYQIHWEPDWHWKGTDEEFIKMYEYAQKAIKANDPDGLLLGADYGVLATGNKHLERLFKKGLGNYLDGIVFHTYYLPQQQSPEKGGLIQDMRKLMDLKNTYLKPGAPLINSEWGVHIWRSLPAPNAAALEQEAAYFMRGHLTTLGEGADTTCFFYTTDIEENGWGWGLFYHLTLPNSMFGATNIAPKPVFAAAAAATRLLEGTKNLGAMEHLGANVWGYAFERKDKVIAAIWATDDKAREISVPAGAETVACYDAMGNEKTIFCKGGQAQISIGAAPVYLLGMERGALPSGSINKISESYLPGEKIQAEMFKGAGNADISIFSNNARFDLADARPYSIPRETAPGKSLVCAIDRASGKWLASKTLDIKSPAEISRQEDSSCNHMTFKVANLLDERVSGAFALEAKGQSDALCAKAMELPPKGSAAVDVELDKLPRQSIASASFTDSHGVRSWTDLHERNVFIAGKSAKPPTIDGTLKEWQLELFRSVSGKDAVKSNQMEWKGDQDLSFKVAAMYDSDALYLALKVNDQSHCQEELSGDIWKGDSVQIGIGLHPDKGAWKMAWSLAFAKSSVGDGDLIAYCHSGNGELRQGSIDPMKIRYAIKRAGDETFYEIAIPWKVLDGSLDSPPEEKRIGVGVLVNDADIESNGHRTKRKTMEAFGGMSKENFGIIILQ